MWGAPQGRRGRVRWPPRDGGLGARRTQNGPRDLNVVCEAKPAGDTWQNAFRSTPCQASGQFSPGGGRHVSSATSLRSLEIGHEGAVTPPTPAALGCPATVAHLPAHPSPKTLTGLKLRSQATQASAEASPPQGPSLTSPSSVTVTGSDFLCRSYCPLKSPSAGWVVVCPLLGCGLPRAWRS